MSVSVAYQHLPLIEQNSMKISTNQLKTNTSNCEVQETRYRIKQRINHTIHSPFFV